MDWDWCQSWKSVKCLLNFKIKNGLGNNVVDYEWLLIHFNEGLFE